MSELEPVGYDTAGNYSDLAPKIPEIEYGMSPEVEAIYMLKLYGRGALDLIDTDPTDTTALSRLASDITLLRQQYPGQELKPFFTVNFGDDLKPADLGERLRSTVPIQVHSLWKGHSNEELNRRVVVGDQPAHLSIRAMVVQRQKNGQLLFPSRYRDTEAECHHALTNDLRRRRFEKHTPGRTLMNLTDMLMVSAVWINSESSIFKPNNVYYVDYQKTWSFRSPFLGFKFAAFRPLVTVAVNNQYRSKEIAMTHESRTTDHGPYLTIATNNVPIYDSVGITLQ